MDRTHPAWPGPGAFQHVVRDSYVALDRTLARLVAGCGGDTTVVLASAYGAAPLHRYFCLLGWLRDEGVLVRHAEAPLRRGLRRLLRAGRGAVPARVTPFADLTHRIDWSRTRAYAPGGAGGGLWVNLKGREPHGIVEPGRDYEAVVADLRRRLLALRDPSTGGAVVTAVHRREEIYHGPHVAEAPDLVLETARTVCAVEGMGPASLFGPDAAANERTGNHARDGLLVMHGDGIRTGLELCSVAVDDLAPTVLYLMGLPVDPNMDGRVLTEALDAERLERQPIEVGAAPGETTWVGAPDPARRPSADLHDRLEGRASA
jgi:predicted AlkP superfamily phosphohydrolase/phosphomutase